MGRERDHQTAGLSRPARRRPPDASRSLERETRSSSSPTAGIGACPWRLRTTSEASQLSPEAIARAREPRERTVIGLHAPFFYDG
jgi:hypothetical protein